jgi:hypothetical protein
VENSLHLHSFFHQLCQISTSAASLSHAGVHTPMPTCAAQHQTKPLSYDESLSSALYFAASPAVTSFTCMRHDAVYAHGTSAVLLKTVNFDRMLYRQFCSKLDNSPGTKRHLFRRSFSAYQHQANVKTRFRIVQKPQISHRVYRLPLFGCLCKLCSIAQSISRSAMCRNTVRAPLYSFA